jgi:hypothetical protein
VRLVRDWKSCWRWFSIQLIAVQAALQAIFIAFPAEMRQYLPDEYLHVLAMSLLASTVLARVADQTPAPAPSEDHARMG